MDEDVQLGPELLREDGLDKSDQCSQQWQEIEKLLKRDQRRAALLMWCCVGLLALGLLSLLVAFSLAPWFERPPLEPGAQSPPVTLSGELVREGIPIFGVWCLGLSPIFAVAWFFFSRMVDKKALRARLASIELLLRKGANDGT